VARTTEIKDRMVQAAEALFARRGYDGVALLDVMNKAGTPRGSIYYHVPNGKVEVAIGVAHKVADEQERRVFSLGQKHREPAAFLQAVVDHHIDKLVKSGYQEGCAVVGITVSLDTDSVELRTAVAEAFTRWIGAISQVLREQGLGVAASRDLATAVVSGIEGAEVISRATGNSASLKRFRKLVPALVGLAGH